MDETAGVAILAGEERPVRSDCRKARMRLNLKLHKINQQRRALIDRLQELPDDLLSTRPLPDKWSIIEILEHLVLSERDVFQGLPKPADAISQQRKPSDRVAYWIVLMALGLRIPVKAPSPKAIPTGRTSFAKLRRQWDCNYEWLESYVKELPGDNFNDAVFSHPIAGQLTLEQAIRMGQIHLALHMSQIEKRLQILTP